MRRPKVRLLAGIVVIAGVLAGCGGSEKKKDSAEPSGQTVRGQTETGMWMTVTTFVDPSTDPTLKRIDAYRTATGHGPAYYMRVVADNTKGKQSDSGREISFATDANAIQAGKAITPIFLCDVLQNQWYPPAGDAKLLAQWRQIMKGCVDGPPKQDGIAPGTKQTYYLELDRGFNSRGAQRMKVFGPDSVQFKPAT